jgi:hypothetical protein
MPITFTKDAEKKPQKVTLVEEGIYKMRLMSNEDKVDTNEKSKRKGFKLHALSVELENTDRIFINAYYENNEGDIVPEGYNYLLSLKNVLKDHYSKDEKMIKKLNEDVSSDKFINRLISDKVWFYGVIKNNTYLGVERSNVNTYEDAVYTLEQAQEIAEKRKIDIKTLTEKKKESNQTQEEEDDDDL